MKRRRFITSIIAATAGLLGLKVARAERAEEPREKQIYAVAMRISGDKSGDWPFGYTFMSADHDGKVNVHPDGDAIFACSAKSYDHAIELAEAARLRYVIGSAMKATI